LPKTPILGSLSDINVAVKCSFAKDKMFLIRAVITVIKGDRDGTSSNIVGYVALAAICSDALNPDTSFGDFRNDRCKVEGLCARGCSNDLFVVL
jgi:hypothetical protein